MTRAPLNRWWVKAAAQGVLAAAPRAAALDDALRRRMREPYLTEDYFLSKWGHVTQHLRALGNPGDRLLLRTRAVEIGTGWFPIVPLGLAVHGGTVVTIDTGKHLDPARVWLAMQRLSQLEAAGTITAASPERMAQLRELLLAPPPASATQLLEPMGIRPVIADAQDLSQVPEAHGSNLLFSNNTLEHIPAEILAGIFREFLRVCSESARMSHYIDLADHYAGFDPRITEFHFLTMSPPRWRLSNNRLGFQNRLRIGDYRELLTQTGWRVTHEKLTRRPAHSLDGLQLVPPYDQVPTKELLVVKAHLVAARA